MWPFIYAKDEGCSDSARSLLLSFLTGVKSESQQKAMIPIAGLEILAEHRDFLKRVHQTQREIRAHNLHIADFTLSAPLLHGVPLVITEAISTYIDITFWGTYTCK